MTRPETRAPPILARRTPAPSSTALVGAPDTVARALPDYVDLGVSTLLIRGYDPLEDATDPAGS